MDERREDAREPTVTGRDKAGVIGALVNESTPDGWSAAADSEAALELVYVDGPAIVVRCDWAPRLREVFGHRNAERPAFYFAACTGCWTTTIDQHSRPSLEVKIRVVKRHIAFAHPAPGAGPDDCEHAHSLTLWCPHCGATLHETISELGECKRCQEHDPEGHARAKRSEEERLRGLGRRPAIPHSAATVKERSR